ncbi:MAG TPA: hypothetical protein VI383_11365, partial [Gemmatimonadales bacterium]|nr:hypothetical protein [Gemmatimonadales bacterium]
RGALGAALVGAMTQWPYASCGLMLYLYLGATAAVVLAGLWGMIASWKRRMPLAHVISIGIALWGALLAGRVIVDRSDYARVPKTWGCQ